MSDKNKELLEQYNLSILNTFRKKGTFQCNTDQGLVLLKEYHGSLRRLALEYEWKQQLIASGFTLVDQYFVTKEDSLVAYDKYHTPFILKRYYNGAECDCRDISHVYSACKNLSALHQSSIPLSTPEMIDELPKPKTFPEFFQRRTRELNTIYRYICNRQRKNAFELSYLTYYPVFYENVCQTLALLKENDSGKECPHGICHGAYHQHNILMLPDGNVATVNFESICHQYYIMDLYLFLRKSLEKTHYDFEFLKAGINGYQENRTLSQEELQHLYLLLLYPEKFWKISNQYYNHRKSWISPRMEEKLEKLYQQRKERESFLSSFASALADHSFSKNK